MDVLCDLDRDVLARYFVLGLELCYAKICHAEGSIEMLFGVVGVG